ncbi:hypothetical protein BGZ83_005343 [Gryganskiella cystojenkinii]|nr:hypothetical protein BGZ83_005343 [Gryganskiella cystojenkinii]
MTIPASSKAEESASMSIVKAAKNAVRPRDSQDRSIRNGIAAVFVELGKLKLPNSHASGLARSTSLASTPHQTVQPTLSLDIFPKNISKPEKEISLPKIGERVEDTPQLAFIASLLTNATTPSSPSQLEWTRQMENFSLEKDNIQRLPVRMVDQFISHPSNDLEAIKEIVLIGPVLSKEHYRRLLNSILAEFSQATMLAVELLHGLVQLVEEAPSGYLESDDMIKILRIIRIRLEDPAQQYEEFSFHLTVAVSKVLNAMADNRVQDLSRLHEHMPLLDVLTGLKTREDPFLRYQALYAFQALQWVPDDETPLHCFIRHFVGVTGSAIKLSGVIQLDFQGFLGGAKEIQKTVGETIEFVKSAWEEVPDMIEDGCGVFDSLKEGLSSGRKHPWYIALRGAQGLVQNGQLAIFNSLVCESPCRQNPLFQWGICQILAEIAVDPSWEAVTRGQAVKFLGAMYTTNQDSTKHQVIRCWVLTILKTISEFSSSLDNDAIKDQAGVLIKELIKKDGDVPFPYPYIFGKSLPLPKSSLLLKEVYNTPDLELHLQRFRYERRQEYNSTAIYIEPLSKESLHSLEDNLTPLKARVESFLASKNEVLLILGDSGAGKSTFNLRLEHDLWNQYQPGDPIPLFIDLKTVNKLENDLIRQKLVADNLFSPEQIDELKRSRQFILICDGYDECRKWCNLHTINRLNRPRQWMAKMVITCRTQYLIPDYQAYIAPQPDSVQRPPEIIRCYEEAVIIPFKVDQIKDYIELHRQDPDTQVVFGTQEVWSTEHYMRQLTNLMDLVKNPFMLKLVLDILPRIAKDDRDLSKIQMGRVELYDEFVMQHFESEHMRLTNQRTYDRMEPDCLAAFALMGKDDFVLDGIDFSKRLSRSIFGSGHSLNSVEYSAKDKGTWKGQYFDPEAGAKVKLLRDSSQLLHRTTTQESINRRSGLARTKNVYAFVHRSMMEYFFSCLVFDPNDDPNDMEDPTGNPPYLRLSACLASDVTPSPVADHPFGQQNLVTEPSIIHFLSERVNQNPNFKGQLETIIQLSKYDTFASQAAANAITILVQAGVHFNGADLHGINIPGADLTGGFFDSVQLQGANLNKVNFTQTWLRDVDFTNASMKDVQFGEKPFLASQGFRTCASTSDGTLLGVGYASGDIRVYDTTNWMESHTLHGHTDMVSCVSFSCSGLLLASGSADKTVRIWDLHQKTVGHVLEGHTAQVNCVAFSPNGSQVASASSDRTVRVWNADAGTLAFVLNAKHDNLQTVAWFPDGERLASGAKNGMLRLWRTATRDLDRRLKVGLNDVQCISISPDGQRLVAGCKNDLHLWNLQTGTDAIVLSGHTNLVTAVAFSKNDQWIASSSGDRSVRLWDARTGVLISTWLAHSSGVQGLAFLNDREIASGTEGIIRIWELDNKLALQKASGDTFSSATNLPATGLSDEISRMVYSPDGKFVFSFGRNLHPIRSTVYSPDGEITIISSQDSNNPQVVELGPNDELILTDSSAGAVMRWGMQNVNASILPNLAQQQGYQLCADGTFAIFVNPRSLVLCNRQDSALKLLIEHFTRTDTSLLSSGSREAMYRRSSRVITYSQCGSWIAFSQSDGVVAVVDTRSGTERALAADMGKSAIVVFSPSGRQLVTSSISHDEDEKNSRTLFWDTQSAECTDTWDFGTRVLAYSPCGIMIAYADKEVVYVWDFRSGRRFKVGEHNGELNCIAWSSCGRWISSGADDGNACIWRIWQDGGSEPTWSCAAIIRDFLKPVKCIAWNPVASSEFVTASADRSFCIWRVVEEDSDIRVNLVWGFLPSRLVTSGAKIRGVTGLSSSEKKLMLQRHAVDGFKDHSFKDKKKTEAEDASIPSLGRQQPKQQ